MTRSALRALSATFLALLSFTPCVDAYTSSIAARDHSNATFSSFVQNTPNGNITFAVTAVKSTGDLYFYIEAPAQNSWVAIGTGSEMEGALMIVAYRSANSKGITLSPRTAEGNVEPSYNDKIKCELNTDANVKNGIDEDKGIKMIAGVSTQEIYVVNGCCKGINKFKLANDRRVRREEDDGDGDGMLDFSNTKQPFIFALGPAARTLKSDAKDAGMRRHDLYGHFQMDLAEASVDAPDDVMLADLSVTFDWYNRNAQSNGSPKKDVDWSTPVHGAVMCAVYVLLFPIGVMLLRLLDRVKLHAWVQGVGLLLAAGGVGLGIWLSRMYNHSKSYTNPHQIIGLAALSLTIIQFSLGLAHHLVFRKHKRRTVMGRIHLFLGPVVLITGAVNGFFGFNFSGGNHNLVYGIIVGVVFIILAISLLWAHRRKSKRANKPRDIGDRVFHRDSAYESYKHYDHSGWGGGESQVQLEHYSEDDHKAHDDRPVHPKPMV
ncbi:CBD9-like protein [Polyplosphaeria fusca]|uniref:CBD9-like protein n=1 Tax=Polyplosphaeria fusca TaxID=682080 RepID=A0A9P4R633_9PLEO|nr:CBD9-like protein [Polyplosphaeria fusca]